MLKFSFQLLKILLVMGFLVAIQFLANEFLPFPANQINILILFLISIFIFTDSVNLLSAALPPALWLDLFSVSPFGLTAVSLFATTIFLNWLLTKVLTNYSIYIIAFTGFLGVVSYRFFFLSFFFFRAFMLREPVYISNELLLGWVSETAVTTLGLLLIYAISSIFNKQLKPHYISLGRSGKI
jgi:hypothetical protein